MRGTFLIGALILIALTLAMWLWQPAPSDPGKAPLVWTTDDNPLRKEQTALFNRTHSKYNLVIDPVNQTIEKVIVQSLAGVGPDLIDARDPNQLAAYVRSGIAWDITSELQKRGIDVQRDTWKVMHRLAVYEGKVYGVPTNCAVNAMWVNKDVVAESGITLPRGEWTWDQLIPIAQKLTKHDKNGKPTQFGLLFDWWNWAHFLDAYGAEVFSEDGTRCLLDSEEAERAIQMMHDLIYKYKVSPSPVEEAGMASAGGWGSGTINLFGAKRGALALGGRWWLANLRNFKGLDLGVVESPYGTTRRFSAAGRVTIINQNSPNRGAALDFLQYMSSKEYNTLINHQADGIAAFKKYSFGPAFEHDPAYPAETDNVVWRDTTEFAYNGPTSPYVSGQLANRILEMQLDLVKIDAKSPRAALRDAAQQIEKAMMENLRKNPESRARWESLTGRKVQ